MKVTSKAQYDKMHELHKLGKLSPENLHASTYGVDRNSLPERVAKVETKKKVKAHAEKSSGRKHKSHKSWD